MSAAPRNLSRREILASAVAAGAGAVLTRADQSQTPAKPARGGTIDADHTPVASTSDVLHFLNEYDREMLPLFTAANEAQWIASTDVTDEHTATAVAGWQKFNEFIGAPRQMDAIRGFRDQAWRYPAIVNRQLQFAWMQAAHAPGTIPDLVKARTEAEGDQSKTQDAFIYDLKQPGKETRKVTANEIDDILMKSTSLDERLAAWTASKEIGVALRPGLIKLQDLRNRVARELKFSSYFGLEVAGYDMGVREMMELLRTVLEQTRPLYEQLHCYTKHLLAKKFSQPVPRRIPAHWLPNRWGQEWPGLEESVDLNPLFKDKTPDWIVKTAESFYVSMGFPPLPETFWRRSDMLELPADAPRKKNRHASAWHIDLQHDVRSLMSVLPDAEWFSTAHHELGHIFYFLAYTDAGVPLLLRNGANPSFHEGFGDLIALASKQQPYLIDLGVLKPGAVSSDPTRWLLAQALDGNFVFMPFACGTMSFWEHDFYEKDLPADKLNARWWELVQQHQGIDPPSPRGEQFCDPASKTHINDTPAYYYSYAIGTMFVYQVHDYIARKILKQDPRSCNYHNRRDVGEYLQALLSLGATRDWREVLRDFTGEDLSARAMMDYYAPLMDFLKKENAGRDVSFAG